MPLQNRVTPMGEIVAEPEGGMFTGNRGIIHDPLTRTLLNRRWATRAWLICALQWRGGPCFLCQRALAVAFQSGFPSYDQAIRPKAPDIDRVLHIERLDGRRKRLHDLTSPATDLPNGAMILQNGAPHLILNGLAYAGLCGAMAHLRPRSTERG